MSQMLQIHSQLRDMILSLDIGPGERMTERWLETRFQGSRTPVRAALVRLEAEGLVQRDGRNWIVAPIDLGEIEALAEFREPLEITAVRLACTRAAEPDLDAIDEMLNACRTGVPREEWHQVGTDFHVEIARLSGNSFLVKAIEGVMTRLSRPRWLEVWTEASREQAWGELPPHPRGHSRQATASGVARSRRTCPRHPRPPAAFAERRPPRTARPRFRHHRRPLMSMLVCINARMNARQLRLIPLRHGRA